MNATNCCATEKQNCGTNEAAQRQDYVANVDVLETAQDYLLTTDVPGAASDQIDVQYEDGELRIHAPVAPRKSPSSATCCKSTASATIGDRSASGRTSMRRRSKPATPTAC